MSWLMPVAVPTNGLSAGIRCPTVVSSRVATPLLNAATSIRSCLPRRSERVCETR